MGQLVTTAGSMHHRHQNDTFVRDHIEQALRPWLGILGEDHLELMRTALARLVADDPHAAALLDAARPRSVERSGECDKVDESASRTPPAGNKTA